MNPEKGFSLRISLTGQCQLRCTYCAPACSPRARASHMPARHIERLVRVLDETVGLSKVHLTGGEPLLRRDVVALVGRLARLNLADLALTTNGQRLGLLAAPLYQVGLRRVNVSLDSLDAGAYAAISRGGEVEKAIDGVMQARAAGLSVKLNTVVLRGINDGEVIDIARWALRRGCAVRYLELMPIGPASGMFHERYVSSAEVLSRLEEAFELQPLAAEPGSTTRRFTARDGEGNCGVIGFISTDTAPFCRGCRRLRLTASGQLIGCLALGLGPEIGPILQAENPDDDRLLVDAARQAAGLKRAGDPFVTERLMIHTGG